MNPQQVEKRILSERRRCAAVVEKARAAACGRGDYATAAELERCKRDILMIPIAEKKQCNTQIKKQ